MVDTNSVVRVEAETLAQEIEASFAQIHIRRYLDVTSIYVIY